MKNELEIASEIRKELKAESKEVEYFTNLYVDICCDDNLDRIARMWGMSLRTHSLGLYLEEPDTIYIEITPYKTITAELDDHSRRALRQIIKLIFIAYDCCDEAVIIEEYDEIECYCRIRANIHRHS